MIDPLYTPEIESWPTEGLEHVECCPVCNSLKRRQLYAGVSDRVFRCAPGQWDLYRCEDCRSGFLDPRATPETIHLAYQTYYTHQMPRRRAAEELTPLRRSIRALANGYRNRRYGGNLQPSNRVGAFLMPLLPPYRQTLDRDLRYLPPLRPGARLLDVGFGNGAFMSMAQQLGWQVAGADPDPVAVANASEAGLDVRQGGIEVFADRAGGFDVITMSHVIEHVHDPCDTLKRAFLFLRPGGCLYIDTPNVAAVGHKKFQEHWRGLEVPRHLVLFTWSSLERVLFEIGFGRIERLCRTDVYPRLAAASRAIEEGEDPYQYKKSKMRDLIIGAFIRLGSSINYERSEYITLKAYKTS